MICTEDDEVLERHSRFLGVRTNNQAEYEALTSALEHVSKLGCQEVTFYLDSEVVVKQINGQYKIRNPQLGKLWSKVDALRRKFKKISFVHVPRTNRFIREVDDIVNQTLDKNQ